MKTQDLEVRRGSRGTIGMLTMLRYRFVAETSAISNKVSPASLQSKGDSKILSFI